MRITLDHNGFHGWSTVMFFGDPVPSADCNTDYSVHVSPQVARRLNDVACGSPHCQCGDQIATEQEHNDYFVFYASEDGGRTGVQRGAYPQES
ncbi:MAG: hypothetical protein JRE40_01185 [Deltaproteobacteria bacterium]|nr:hypothetical protein [Deltaproteobacteria bacterium]